MARWSRWRGVKPSHTRKWRRDFKKMFPWGPYLADVAGLITEAAVHRIKEYQALTSWEELDKMLFGDPSVPKPQGVINVPATVEG